MAGLELRTKCLRLAALTLEQLEACLRDPQCLARDLDVYLAPGFVDAPAQRAIAFKTKKMSELAVEAHPWYTYWLIVIDEESRGVGLAGFKGAPDDHGQVEIGYGIDPAYRRRGYTAEAVEALIAWAFRDPACRAVLADTLKENVASNRLLVKVGMQVYYETDEGLCWKIESV
jgi:ribosomal protein S18 acetylase RimI-like enzyme